MVIAQMVLMLKPLKHNFEMSYSILTLQPRQLSDHFTLGKCSIQFFSETIGNVRPVLSVKPWYRYVLSVRSVLTLTPPPGIYIIFYFSRHAVALAYDISHDNMP